MHPVPEGNRLFARNITNHLKFNYLLENKSLREDANYFEIAKEIAKAATSVAQGHQHLGFKKGIAIASLNINSLRSHFDEVNLMIQRLGIYILALNETKLDNSIPNELTDISGYQQLRRVRSCHGGGVSIYVRNSINFKPRDDISAEGLEIICIEIEPPKSKPFLVIVWYRPPGCPVGSFDKLEKVLAYLDREGKEMIILLGETNCDFTKKINHQFKDNNAKHMVNLYELFSLKQLVVEPTRVTL